MPTEVIMPRLGWDMKVGSVAEWLKRDGDRVEVGETICMIAGDKATTELEALDSGILRIPLRSPEVGEEVPVGTLLAYVVAPDEALPTEATSTPGHRDNGGPRSVASPRARRAAAAAGIDWRTLVGTGRGGRVLERDVTRAASEREEVRPAAAEVAVSLHGVRRLTAERMALSARTVAAVTLTTEADATTLVRLREQALAERHDSDDDVPGYTDFMIKIVAMALTEHPALNATLTDDGIVQHTQAHIALGVDTPQGLIAPVVHDASARSVASIARESRQLIGAARAGTSRPEELAGGTFTITNLGMFDVDAFTPMVNLPQCAILGLGRIVARPVVVDEASEQVAVRRMLSLSLTFDHRLVDGAPAARFLQRVKHLVERPTIWLFR
jgi:pyruvate dehydrogenase E2 component (dihydrolipoamide acetyltransferase)